jgi:shikimate dehydrogenase
MYPTINGQTDLYLIPGDPVEQVRAPQVFNLIFKKMGINAVLVPAHVKADGIEAFVQSAFLAQNVKGLFLAIPHKTVVMGLLASCNSHARVAGAVNGVRRNANGQLEGGLFDGTGFVLSLDHFGIACAGKRVLILGAGGGASAIAAALATAGVGAPAHIALYDPIAGKSQGVIWQIENAMGTARIEWTAAGTSDPTGYDLVVNASPLGLEADDAMPCDVTRLAGHAVVVDILMKNQPTRFLQAVRARGLQAEPGFEMLIQQAPDYLEFFGYPDAAHAVRSDARFIRELVYPPGMASETGRRGSDGAGAAARNGFAAIN